MKDGMGASEQVKSEARDWFARLSRVDRPEETVAAFRAWLKASEDNAAAFEALAEAWDDLALLNLEQDLAARAPITRPRRSLRVAFGGVLAGVAALAAVLVAFVVATGPADPIEHQTGVGEIRTVTLADGSSVTLDARSRIIVDFSKGARTVALSRGRAFFEVASDPARPFSVDAGAATATAVGTAFAVRRGEAVRVAVTEGLVDVAPRSGDVLRLAAGDVVAAEAGGVLGGVAGFNAERLLDWRNGRLAFDDAALSEIVADMNRHRRKPIVIVDEPLGALRFTTAFRADETDVFLAALPSLEPVQIIETDAAVLIHAPRER
ncbi:MAG: FecR domain-containing protein [Pseudomonadota bacterium]